MKKVLVLLCLCLTIGVHTGAQASPTPGDFYKVLMDPVCFWVGDPVELSVTNNLPTGYDLEFGDGVEWGDFGSTQIFDTGAEGFKLVYVRLINNGGKIYRAGKLTFQNFDQSVSLYKSLTIGWKKNPSPKFRVTFSTAPDAKIKPTPTPIPATMLLFGSGLIGLVGLRKKLNY